MNTNLDFFSVDASSLKKKKLFLFDMDGTIYNDGVLFEGTLELLETIKNNGGKYVFLTNNSSKSVNDYLHRLRALGINVDVDNFCTSSQVTVDYLKKNYSTMKVYCQGTKSLIKEFESAGINVVSEVSDDIEVIVVGFDTELTSEKIRNTCQLLTRGLPFIATNMDLACPVSFGYIPDCGSICMMLENATGRKPIYIGKPDPGMVNFVVKEFGYSLDDAVIVGDRLYTDIATGINAGITSICVLTGEATTKEIENSTIKPTFTFNSVKDIYRILQIKRIL